MSIEKKKNNTISGFHPINQIKNENENIQIQILEEIEEDAENSINEAFHENIVSIEEVQTNSELSIEIITNNIENKLSSSIEPISDEIIPKIQPNTKNVEIEVKDNKEIDVDYSSETIIVEDKEEVNNIEPNSIELKDETIPDIEFKENFISNKKINDDNIQKKLVKEISSLEKEIDLIKQNFRELLEKTNNSINSNILLSQSKLNEKIEELHDNERKNYDEIVSTLNKRLEIERKVNEENEKLIFDELSNQIKRQKKFNRDKSLSGNYGMGLGSNPFLSSLIKRKKSIKNCFDFSKFEQLINKKQVTGNHIRRGLNLLITDLELDSNSMLRPIYEIILKIEKIIELEDKYVISYSTRDRILKLFDEAYKIYSNYVPKKNSISKKEILMQTDNLLKRIQYGTSVINLKTKMKSFMNSISDLKSQIDPYVIRDIKEKVEKINSMNNTRLTLVEQNKLITEILYWKKSIEKSYFRLGSKNSKMEIKAQLNIILKKLSFLPVASEMRSLLGNLRAIISSVDFAKKMFIIRECDEIERELVKLSSLRLSTVEREKYNKILLKWKKILEESDFKKKKNKLEPLLNWVDKIINEKESNPPRDVYKLLIILNREILALEKHSKNEKTLRKMIEFKRKLEKNMYEKISLETALKYKTIFETWSENI